MLDWTRLLWGIAYVKIHKQMEGNFGEEINFATFFPDACVHEPCRPDCRNVLYVCKHELQSVSN